MGKKNKPGLDLGRSLIKDRFGGSRRAKKFVGDKSMVRIRLRKTLKQMHLSLLFVFSSSILQKFKMGTTGED